MIHYYIGIIRKLSVLKIWNFILLYSSFLLSKILNRPVHRGSPFFISVEPTTSCNLRCPQCPSGLREFTRDRGMLDKDFFEKILMQVKGRLHSIIFYFQGEPYLNPDFLTMVKSAGEQGIYTSTSTNAHYLTRENAIRTVESGLDKIIISLDGVTQESYESYRRGGQLDKVIEGTRELISQKKRLKRRTPHVIWQFVVFRSNEHEIAAYRKLGRELGVDEVRLKTAQIYDFDQGENILPLNGKYSRYRKNALGRYVIKNELLNECWRMWQGCVVTWDGKIVPCCFDKDASHTLGSLKEHSFNSIWRSPSYAKFRQSVMLDRKAIDICTNCSEGSQVWT